MLSRVAGEIADGDITGLVVLDVARSLVDLLDLRDCEFQLPPFVDDDLPCLRRDGRLELQGTVWDPATIGFPPGGFLVPVVARGCIEGRYRCTPRGRRRVSAERVVVALTLADQTASALLLDSVA
ncbi:MAG TPA: hypothetical protein VIL36_21310 [Acidimicrobiales bacterium]